VVFVMPYIYHTNDTIQVVLVQLVFPQRVCRRLRLLAWLRPAREFLFGTVDGLIGDNVWRVTKEGNDVRYFVRERSVSRPAGILSSCEDSHGSRFEWDPSASIT
jgi:hypothetical protein